MAHEAGRGVHDMGGLPSGPVARTQHEFAAWERKVDALMMLLTRRDRPVITVDELRRGIEQLGPEAYDRMSYYERWIASITSALLEKGVVSTDELGRRMEAFKARFEVKT